MKRLLLFTLVLGAILSLGGLTGCKPQSKVTEDKSIVILYENDVHCAIDKYSKIAGLRDLIKDTADVALVSSGDYFQGGTAGAISNGKYVVDVMKEANYDVVTLGNHEFDYKMPRMMELLKMLQTPVACVNLKNVKTGRFVFSPYIMKTLGDKKVAFVGATTPSARYTEEYAFVDEQYAEIFSLSPNQLPDLVQKAVDDARSAGADYVVLLSHLGEDKTDEGSDSHSIIRKTEGIDVVLDGHTHSEIPFDTVHSKIGKPVVISQTGTKFKYIGKLLIRNGKITTELLPTEEMTVDNPTVKKAYEVMNSESSALTSTVLGQLEHELLVYDAKSVKVIRLQETNAGDLVADALLACYDKADMAMLNAGGIRTTIAPGKLTYGDVVNLLPYDNKLMVVEITGEEVVTLLTMITSDLPADNGDFPQVSGVKFTVDGTKHIVSNVQVLNRATKRYEPIDLKKNYKIAMFDYTVTGGGFKGYLKNKKVIYSDSKTANDVFVWFLKEKLNGHIGDEYAKPQGRITIQY